MLLELVVCLAARGAEGVKVIDVSGAVGLKAHILKILVQDLVQEGLKIEDDDVARHFTDLARGVPLLL